MYITKEQLEQRLKKTSGQVTKKEQTRGRTEDKHYSHEERVLAGTLAHFDTCKNVSELTGMSAGQVSAVSRGLTNPSTGKLDKELEKDVKAIVGETKRKVEDVALDALSRALTNVNERIKEGELVDLTDMSKVAVDMSKILDKVSGEARGDKGNGRVIIINAPPRRNEDSYKQIIVQEKAS